MSRWMLFCFLVGSLWAADDPLNRLVRDLGDRDFNVRERAARELRAAGAAAIPVLTPVENSADPEVRQRARELLGDLRLGIDASWPPEWVQAVRGYDEVPVGERAAVRQRVVAALGAKAVPFLVRQVQADEAVAGEIRALQPSVAEVVVRELPAPRTAAERRLRAWALGELGRLVDALTALGEQPAGDATRSQLVEAAVKELRRQLQGERPPGVVATARQMAEAFPQEARLQYLFGWALFQAGQRGEAEAVSNKAVTLNPQDEAAHFTAADMLTDLGQSALAAREYELILQIPPADGIYDLNAHFRLASIRAEARQYAIAAAAYEQGLALYRALRAKGEGVAMMGGNEKRIEGEIARLRRLRDAEESKDLRLHLAIVFKDFKEADRQAALRGVETTMTVNVQPHGFRLFDLAEAGMRYDPVKHQVMGTLNGQVAGDPADFVPRGPTARIAVSSLDCDYVYDLDAQTGAMLRRARFEKDYRVQLLAGEKVQALQNIVVTVNGETNDWPKLQRGVPFDFLPEKLEIIVTGMGAGQTNETYRLSAPVKEPPLELPR